MKQLIFAANWKMNHAPPDAAEFLRAFLTQYQRMQDRTVILFPPALTLSAVVAGLRERSDIHVGVQHIHWEDKGAFTGENSAPIARGSGARYALIGHSERRHLFGETDDQTRLKTLAALRAGLTPVLCVGERLEERERGETERVVLRQLRAATEGLEAAQIGQMILAYEPVWAIGTGQNATPEQAGEVHGVLREVLRLPSGRSGGVPILYGGSVTQANVTGFLQQDHVDGVLVGGASLDPTAWRSIVATRVEGK